jgi:hypothetical protein
MPVNMCMQSINYCQWLCATPQLVRHMANGHVERWSGGGKALSPPSKRVGGCLWGVWVITCVCHQCHMGVCNVYVYV